MPAKAGDWILLWSCQLILLFEPRQLSLSCHTDALKELQTAVAAMQAAAAAVQAPFAWVDGPLIIAMKLGHAILLDEINLAEDAVLERLNRWVTYSNRLLSHQAVGLPCFLSAQFNGPSRMQQRFQ